MPAASFGIGMDTLAPDQAVPLTRLETLLDRVARYEPTMRGRATALDAAVRFAEDDLYALRELGVLAAPLPARLGGLGLGTEPEGASGILALLRLLGRGNLSVGRVFEAHVNALRLVILCGTESQQRQTARDAQAGHLFALWCAETGDGLRIAGPTDAPRLRGAKSFCSAAGWATRAIVTATDAECAVRMVLVEAGPGVHAEKLEHPPQGMRAAGTGRMRFDDLEVPPEALLGGPGDYLREPEFSAGAWRTSAVTLGGLEALVGEARAQLAARGRDADPHQRARIGRALIAQETAALWVRKAGLIAEGTYAAPEDRHAYVNLARVAVEAAALDAVRLIQHSLGLTAFVPPNPVERLMRDLQTYLRQPAPDEALTDAAVRYFHYDLPAAEAVP